MCTIFIDSLAQSKAFTSRRLDPTVLELDANNRSIMLAQSANPATVTRAEDGKVQATRSTKSRFRSGHHSHGGSSGRLGRAIWAQPQTTIHGVAHPSQLSRQDFKGQSVFVTTESSKSSVSPLAPQPPFPPRPNPFPIAQSVLAFGAGSTAFHMRVPAIAAALGATQYTKKNCWSTLTDLS